MKQKILIAEDEADIRNILKLYLESEGLEVVQAQDGEQALRMAQQEMPDLILLDVMMPNMDGFAVTQALRQYSQVPILILSARS